MRLVLAFCAAACLAGCGRVADFAAVSRGNRLHERGLYQEAAAAYLGVARESFGPTVEYDLANVYARLGEYPAASELYERVRRTVDPGLRGDAAFNAGVALYEKGRYEEAWRSFKDALGTYLAAPSAFPESFARDARRNLELAWLAWRKRSPAPPDSVAPSSRLPGGQDEAELRLLRRLETGTWKPGTKGGPADERGDY